jgi:hypothetical protein
MVTCGGKGGRKCGAGWEAGVYLGRGCTECSSAGGCGVGGGERLGRGGG